MRLAPGTYRFKNSGTTGITVKVDNVDCVVLGGDTSELTCADSIIFTPGSTLAFGRSTATAVASIGLTGDIPSKTPAKKVFSSKKY
jgi:hypothetical protein